MTWVLGGVGVLGLGTSGYFGVRGVTDYDRFDCGTGCRPDEKSQVDTEFRVADIGLLIGVGALSAALVFLLTRSSSQASSASIF